MTEIPSTTPAPVNGNGVSEHQEPRNRDGLWGRTIMQDFEETMDPGTGEREAFTLVHLLERGHPAEIMPGSLRRMEEAARKYVADGARHERARARVRDVWLDGKYRPAYLGEVAQRRGE